MNSYSFKIIFSILLSFSIHISLANQLPPKNHFVNDFASIIIFQDFETIDTRLEQLHKKTGIEIVVVTIDSVSKYGYKKKEFESFGADLFKQWDIGDKNRDDGILILLSKKDQKVRIELGNRYSGRLNMKIQNILNNVMLPLFKSGHYSQGLVEGVDTLADELTILYPQSTEQTTESSKNIKPVTTTTQEHHKTEPVKQQITQNTPGSMRDEFLGILGVLAIFGGIYFFGRRDG